MSSPSRFEHLGTLGKVFIAAVLLISAYESLKQWIFGNDLSLWESHLMTAVIGAIVSVAVAAWIIAKARQHEQEALRIVQKSSAFNKTLLDSIPVAVFFKDGKGRYLGCNQRFSEVMGVSEDEVRGRTVMELWPGELAATYHQKDLDLLAAPTTQTYEFKVRDKNGQLRDVIYGKAVFRDEAGNAAGIIGTFFDITEKNRLENELRLAKTEAEMANRSKSAFMAKMSQELRAPFHHITSLAHLLRREQLTPRQEKHLDMFDEAGHRLAGIINTLFELTAIESQKFTLSEASLDLNILLAKTIELAQPGAAARQLTLLLDVPTLPAGLKGDASHIKRALISYLDNAIRLTDRGSVTLHVTVDKEDASEALLRFAVRDTGPGIAPEDLPRLFNIFEQAGHDSAAPHGGMGAGLAITKELARLMGGDAGCESTPGQGSTFWFTARLRKS